LLIVPHRTLDAGGCRSSGESTQLLAILSFCTLLPQLRHGSAINAAAGAAVDVSNRGAAFRD